MVANREMTKKVQLMGSYNTTAMKSACNEVKGLVEWMMADTCGSARVRKPLIALIHYRGFCVIAEAIVCYLIGAY
jgi:hypothetical protein